MGIYKGMSKKSLAATYFPTPYRGSIIGVRRLNFRVRNGIGCYTSTIVTKYVTTLKMKREEREKREKTLTFSLFSHFPFVTGQ